MYDYASALFSIEVDATAAAGVRFMYDYHLDNYANGTTTEGMSFQVYDGTQWVEIENVTCLTPGRIDIPWTTSKWDISSLAAGRMFKVRFVAYGEYSFNIDNWYIDNIKFDLIPATMPQPQDLTVAQAAGNVNLNWTTTGAEAYKVYASDDPTVWEGTPVTVTTNSYSTPVGTDTKKFYKVTSYFDNGTVVAPPTRQLQYNIPQDTAPVLMAPLGEREIKK